MPTYEYICDACGNEFENFASMSAPPIKKCPKCKKNKVHRKISTGGGIIFKGGGFYETDYRGDAYKKAADADKAPSPADKTDGATPAVAESKPTTGPAAAEKAVPDQTQVAAPEPKPVVEKPSEPAPSRSASKSASKSKR